MNTKTETQLLTEIEQLKKHISELEARARGVGKRQRESESRYRALFENMSAASCMDEIVYENGRAVDYRIIDVNPAYEHIMGIRRQDAAGSLASVLFGLGQAPFLDEYSRVAETGEPEEFEAWFEPIQKHLHITVGRPKPGFFSTVFTDITERKKAEEQIRDNETRLQSLIRILQHQSSSVQTFLDYALDEAIQLTESRLGYIYFYNEKKQEFTLNTWSKGVMDVCAVTEPQTVYQLENTGIWGEAVRQRKAILINDFQAPHPLKKGFPDGHASLNKFLTVPVFSRKKIVAVVGVANKETDYDQPDVLQLRLLMDGVWKETDRILRENTLRQEKEWSQKIIDNAPNIILGLRENSKIAVFNKFAERLTGYTAQEVVGKEWISLFIPQENQETLYQTWNQIVDNQLVDHQFESEIVTKSGEMRLIKWHNAVLTENNAFWMILSVGEDITEQKALAAQFQQAQKMESVGRLAGGVAHDYNNMLSIIIGYTQLAMGKVSTADPLHADLKEIDKAAQRSAEITRKLLGFARKQTVSPKVLDLNTAVEGMLKMLRRLLREDITLSWHPGTGVWQVKIDPSQVDQVLMNLCVNARDAIDGTGEISIETGNRVFDQDYCADHNGFVPGEFVMLAISDNGCGMDKKTLDHIFEPFFTTKQVGQGSGLGLAMVYGIVKQNKGFINVYSEPGRGTTLKLYFARDRTGIVEKTVADIPHPDAGRGETILVVEDESALLKLATRLLETLGYTVLSASHPDNALRLAKKHPGKIHLLLTDVVMPDMNGRELADRLLALYPDLKLVFMSGYTANVIAHQGVLDKGMHFIQKPLSIHALAATVRQALDNP
jgi:PAS domain S-box-containing protein